MPYGISKPKHVPGVKVNDQGEKTRSWSCVQLRSKGEFQCQEPIFGKGKAILESPLNVCPEGTHSALPVTTMTT